MEYSLNAGFLATRYENFSGINENDWAYNPAYDAQINYIGQKTETILKIAQSRQAFANGSETNLLTFKVGQQFKFNEKTLFDYGGHYERNVRDKVFSNRFKDGFEQYFAFKHHLSDSLEFFINQKYRHENYKNNEDAQRNIIKVGLNYHLGKGG
jgi:hypothetical protein